MIEQIFEIKQIPDKDKQQAVVEATIKDEYGTRKAIGAVCISNRNSEYDPQFLIDQASKLAFDRAMNHTFNIQTQQEATQTSQIAQHVPQHTIQTQDNQGNARRHNPTPGSASPNQLSALGRIAHEHNTDLASVTHKEFGITPEDMSSEQVNSLFGYFKPRK